jgi:CheY-like chemotaxis protein
MNGYDVARAFRADAALGGAFLVALTGYAMSEDLEQAAAAGFDQHLVKPPDLEKLERVLDGLPAPRRGRG